MTRVKGQGPGVKGQGSRVKVGASAVSASEHARPSTLDSRLSQIIVCVKQVPDFSRVDRVPLDPRTGAIVRAGVPAFLNPFDRHAVEEALRLREAHGGIVTAVTMGPPQARTALQDTLIMGADRAVLLSDAAFAGADTLATSYVLAQAIRRLGPFDLVICGRETLDSGTGHVAPSLAEWLDLPQITYVRKLEIRGGLLWAQRTVEDGYQEIQGPVPMVISVTKETNEPRPLRLRAVAAAAEKEIAVWGLADLGLERELVGLAGSPTQVPRVFPPEPRPGAEIIDGSPPAAVDALIARLRELKAI